MSDLVAAKVISRFLEDGTPLSLETQDPALQEANLWHYCSKEIQNRIASFIGVCLTDKNIMLISHYYEGGSLQSFLKVGLAFLTSLRIMLHISEAIQSLHERDILHRGEKCFVIT